MRSAQNYNNFMVIAFVTCLGNAVSHHQAIILNVNRYSSCEANCALLCMGSHVHGWCRKISIRIFILKFFLKLYVLYFIYLSVLLHYSLIHILCYSKFIIVSVPSTVNPIFVIDFSYHKCWDKLLFNFNDCICCDTVVKAVHFRIILALTFWRRIFFFQILAHPVFKMRVIQEPNKVALWNKLHFEEKKMEIIQHV